jgi:hypothetical protein
VPTTFLLTSGYWENLINCGWRPQKSPNGLVLVFPIGQARIPMIDPELQTFERWLDQDATRIPIPA